MHAVPFCAVTAAVVAVFVMAAVAGCSSNAPQAATATVPKLPPVPTPTESSVLQISLPISAYELTMVQDADEQYLVQLLRQRCMDGFGLTYNAALTSGSIAQSVRIDNEFESRRYGISDAAAVATYGYHLPSWVEGSAAPMSISKLPSNEAAVFTGSVRTYGGRAVPSGGCLAEAANTLAQAGIGAGVQQNTVVGDSGSLVNEIETNAFEQAQADPRVLAVFGKWSACMRSYGYDYATPFLAAADKRWASNAPASAAASAVASATEIQTAKRDVACKLKVNLLGVEFAVESDYQNIGIAQNAQSMQAIKTQVEAEAAAVQSAMTRYRT